MILNAEKNYFHTVLCLQFNGKLSYFEHTCREELILMDIATYVHAWLAIKATLSLLR